MFPSRPSQRRKRNITRWGGPAAEKPAKNAEPVALQDLNLTGKISKSQKTDKKGSTTNVYVLVDPNGLEINLPIQHALKPKKGEAAVPVINLEAYVDKTVAMVAKGTETRSKTGARSVRVKEIICILLAGPDALPAVAPAAPAPTAATAPVQ